MIHIILIRHGKTAWNAAEGQDERFRGRLDVPLAEEGVAQAHLTADRLARWPLAAVYSSPLQRALRTAEIIAAPHRLAVRPLPGLTSMSYGRWAGQLHSDVAQRWPDQYGAWRRDPFTARIPGGELRLSEEHDAFAWVPESALASWNVIVPMQPVIRQLPAHANPPQP